MDKLLLRPEEAANALGISRSKMYQMLALGKVPCVWIEKSVRIPAEALRRWVEDQANAQKEAING